VQVVEAEQKGGPARVRAWKGVATVGASDRESCDSGRAHGAGEVAGDLGKEP
jgi:hypothetical protein